MPQNLFQEVNEAVSNSPLRYLQAKISNGVVEGNDYVGLNPTRVDANPGSFRINIKTGKFIDHATGDKGGDWVSLHAYLTGQKNFQAAVELAGLYGVQVEQKKADPDKHSQFGKPDHKYLYERVNSNGDIVPYFYVVRWDAGKGRKDKVTRPFSIEGGFWGKPDEIKGETDATPLFGLRSILENGEKAVYVICEGEKATLAMQDALESGTKTSQPMIAISWGFGVQSIKKTDWTPLFGKKVIIVPDNDTAGRKAAAEIALRLQTGGNGHVKIADICSGMKQGADAADLWDGKFAMAEAIVEAIGKEAADPSVFTRGIAETAKLPQIDEDPVPALEEKEDKDLPWKSLGLSKTPDGKTQYNFYSRRTERRAGQKQGKGAILTYNRNELGQIGTLIELADLDWWETHYLHEDAKKLPFDQIQNMLIRGCDREGYINIDEVRRGRGVWKRTTKEKGTYLLIHAGNSVHQSIDKAWEEPLIYSSPKQLFEQQSPIPFQLIPPKLFDEDAAYQVRNFYNAVTDVPFQVAIMGEVLVGWLALAPFCGALEWRPHIFLSGPAQSGKSMLFNNFVLPALGKWCIPAESTSTEAGLRRSLGNDAMPIVVDEAGDKGGKRWGANFSNILHLARAASNETEASVKQADKIYRLRTMMLLCDIVSGMNQAADLSRFFLCVLRNQRELTADEKWTNWDRRRRMMDEARSGHYALSDLLFSFIHHRFFDITEILQPAVNSYLSQQVASISSRQAMQLSPMIAASWAIRRGIDYQGPYDIDEMLDEIKHVIGDIEAIERRANIADEMTMIETIFSRTIPVGSGKRATPIGYMIENEIRYQMDVAAREYESREECLFSLSIHGIKIYSSREERGWRIFFSATNAPLDEAMEKTSFSSSNTRAEYLRQMGAKPTKQRMFRHASPVWGCSIPATDVIDFADTDSESGENQ